MDNKKDKNKFWQDICLVILGAFLASIPTLIATQIHAKTELRRVTIDQQITAIKALSLHYNKVATEVLPSIEKSHFEVENCYNRYKQKLSTAEECTSVIEREHITLTNIARTQWADWNAQRIIVNALFNVDLPPVKFVDLWNNMKTKDSKADPGSLEEGMRELQSTNREYIKSINESIDSGQELLNRLVLRINFN